MQLCRLVRKGVRGTLKSKFSQECYINETVVEREQHFPHPKSEKVRYYGREFLHLAEKEKVLNKSDTLELLYSTPKHFTVQMSIIISI